MSKARRTFTRGFKVEAVKLVTEQGRSFAEAAANLSIAESLLRNGKKKASLTKAAKPFLAKATCPPLKTSCAACGPKTNGCKWNATF